MKIFRKEIFKKEKNHFVNSSKTYYGDSIDSESNNKIDRFYDENDALEFIFKETGVDKRTIRNIMNADLRYQKSVGIIDWDDLDDYIEYWNKYLDKHN